MQPGVKVPALFPEHVSSILLNTLDGQKNRSEWEKLKIKHMKALGVAGSQRSSSSQKRHKLRGQLLARDRIALLLDEDSLFLELCAFAGHELQDSTPSASVVAGVGTVNGVCCIIFAHIPSINGGAWNEFTVKKQNRVTEIATENGLPMIALVQSAGVFLPLQFRVFHAGGQIFRDLAVRSSLGQSSCAVVFGSSTAGGAYHPAMSDYTIFVKDQAQVFLGGPPLVKMATGEIAEAEALGGADMHAMVTGLSNQLALDEFDAIDKARAWVFTASNSASYLRLSDTTRPISFPPKYDSKELLSIINPDVRQPMDMMEVILRVVDSGRVELFKPLFGTGMLTAWARIHGNVCGIVANQRSVINPSEAMKATQFIRLCNQGNTPIVFLHNVAGFMVGLQSERAGLIRLGAQLVSAISTSTVPHISIICGASYGAGNHAMCGRAYKPRFLFTWITGRCSVMGPDQLSGVMEEISRVSARKSNSKLDETKLKDSVKVFRDGVEFDSQAYRTSAYLIDDRVIDPQDTRDILGMCLEIVQLQPIMGSRAFSSLARL